MLSPDSRSLYTAALTPPPGYKFEEAIATTYSLDPSTLLTIPAYLALIGRSTREELDPIAVLEALRRVTNRITIYAQAGLIQVPQQTHLLYGLLEPLLVESQAPRGGAFHPKIWLIKFAENHSDRGPLYRLLILSRNMTADRSWDLSLQLDGHPVQKRLPMNRPLSDLIAALPELSVRGATDRQRAQSERLSDEIRYVEWELPTGFKEIHFHILGFKHPVWLPRKSQQMVVISPFVSGPALRALQQTTKNFIALISRPEELDTLNESELDCCEEFWTLDEAAITEDGEEADQQDTLGLHAKAYLLRVGWDTHMIMGSANATSAAILHGNSVEILAELVGKRSRVGEVIDLFSENGFGSVLTRYQPSRDTETIDEKELDAEQALEKCRKSLATADLQVVCAHESDGYRLILKSKTAFSLAGIESIKAWPITVPPQHSVESKAIATAQDVNLSRLSVASVTGIIAFEVQASEVPINIRFALNLPLENLPDDRDTAIMQSIINNRDGFLRYLLLLLGDLGDFFTPHQPQDASSKTMAFFGNGFSEDYPLVEELTRAFSRDPERLARIKDVIDKLRRAKHSEVIVPPDFLSLWEVFSDAMGVEQE